MKKYFGLFSLLLMTLAIMSSCSKENEEDMAYNEKAILNNSSGFTGDSVVINYPSAIDDYVNQNYPNETIEEVEIDEDGNYEVELSDETELLFDATGIFIEVVPEDEDEDDDEDEDEDDEDEDDEDDDEDEDEDDEEDEDSTIDYPTAIDDYLATNFPNAVIVEVELEDNGNFEVELDDGTELLFDPEGNIIL